MSLVVEELQIGDWVTYCNESFQVDYIIRITNAIGLKYKGKNPNFGDGEICAEDASPIPLAPKILEKNGWKEAQFWHEYQDGKNTIQSCLPDMRGIINGVEIQHFKCEYVHQYQHLLRLCGLEELAENFEV